MNIATSTSDSRIVLVKGCAGLGNRLLSLLSAVLYAKMTGRVVVVDWRDGTYADPGINSFPLLFQSSFAHSLTQDLMTESVEPRVWHQRLPMSAGELHRLIRPRGLKGCPFLGSLYSFNPKTLDHQDEVIVVWSLVAFIGQLRRHFAGQWAGLKKCDDATILAGLLHENLELHPEIAARAQEIQQAWPVGTRIGVHVRNTDRTTNLNRVTRRLDALLKKQPGAMIFLATDDQLVEELFKRRYVNVLTFPKWFPPSGPLHSKKAPCPDRLSMAKEMLVEMSLLLACDHLVINSNSSFSQIAKLWWRGDQSRITDVASWAWLPGAIRERAWRTKAFLKCFPFLWSARRHIRTKWSQSQ
jgi:hypothetical protein